MRKNKYIERKSEKERIITERRGEIPMKSMDICACQSATGAGKARQAKKRTAENGKCRKSGKHGCMYEDGFCCFHISSADCILFYKYIITFLHCQHNYVRYLPYFE